MNIEQELNLLQLYCNTQLIINLGLKHDFILRDISEYRNNIANNLTYFKPLKGFDINHGWGKLQKKDKQKYKIQMRYFYFPPTAFITFDSFKNSSYANRFR